MSELDDLRQEIIDMRQQARDELATKLTEGQLEEVSDFINFISAVCKDNADSWRAAASVVTAVGAIAGDGLKRNMGREACNKIVTCCAAVLSTGVALEGFGIRDG